MQDALDRFHQHRTIFEEVGIRPDGFSLPRQHALEHYIAGIKLFGSPNGLCSSITESKHIRAVKRPWRRSSKNNPLVQILTTNQRLDKLQAARTSFIARGMLQPSRTQVRVANPPPDDEDNDDNYRGYIEGEANHQVLSEVTVSQRPAYSRNVQRISALIEEPHLEGYLRRFLFDQENEDLDISGDDLPVEDCPELQGNIGLYHIATATFYAPSDASGTGGLRHELIRSTASWLKGSDARYDTVLINIDPTITGMRSMLVARVKAFLMLSHDNVAMPCALVQWFETVGDQPNEVTGIWAVRPEMFEDQQVTSVVHLDTIVRAVHLVPVFKDVTIPVDFRFAYSLDAFDLFYVNRYIDYHTFECIS
ncbi:hypothetical protein QCA50_020436 [Cerrena zonata]|uniref:Uncharacterized protein n=1 Tax=Cerrena zonata TaxID=2478898 RepID=A0AAW0FC96_9APHY